MSFCVNSVNHTEGKFQVLTNEANYKLFSDKPIQFI